MHTRKCSAVVTVKSVFMTVSCTSGSVLSPHWLTIATTWYMSAPNLSMSALHQAYSQHLHPQLTTIHINSNAHVVCKQQEQCSSDLNPLVPQAERTFCHLEFARIKCEHEYCGLPVQRWSGHLGVPTACSHPVGNCTPPVCEGTPGQAPLPSHCLTGTPYAGAP